MLCKRLRKLVAFDCWCCYWCCFSSSRTTSASRVCSARPDQTLVEGAWDIGTEKSSIGPQIRCIVVMFQVTEQDQAFYTEVGKKKWPALYLSICMFRLTGNGLSGTNTKTAAARLGQIEVK